MTDEVAQHESAHSFFIKNHSMDVDSITQTRITGIHQRWPSDPDTVNRLKKFRCKDPQPEPRGRLFAVAVCLIVAVVWAGVVYFIHG